MIHLRSDLRRGAEKCSRRNAEQLSKQSEIQMIEYSEINMFTVLPTYRTKPTYTEMLKISIRKNTKT